ncbi:MAG: hypothetical protein PHW82_15620 [Bacteroidales bacterium]|nr:hypothetical protein [Bacteroidales bacterium]
MKKIEQIFKSQIIDDFDEKLSPSKLREVVRKDFVLENNANPYTCKVNGKGIVLYIKQITYLGHPHLAFKKRIQISKGWQIGLSTENAYLIGVYKYKDTILYTLFDKTNFVTRTPNNSSAHVSTFDLLNAEQKGIFTKKDIRGNIITCVRRDLIINVLSKIINSENILSQETLLFEDFKLKLKPNYHGIECYSELISKNYRNKFQPEWFAFYLEYKFEIFLEENPTYKSICCFQSKKSKDDIDLDLNFNNEFLGDLKTHSNTSGAILGNDIRNIEKALKKGGKLWYIVFNHNTFKDSDFNYEVTNFWNSVLEKKDKMSYSKRMKNKIELTDYMILEINYYNKKYLADFNQGVNSNKLPREPKIKINKKMINNFLIFSSKI